MNMELYKWMVDLDHWSPAQIYYFFEDDKGGRRCIYLRWRHNDPWTAELVPCDWDWDLVWSDEVIELFPARGPRPVTSRSHFSDNEYPALMKVVLQEVKKIFPGLAFPNNE